MTLRRACIAASVLAAASAAAADGLVTLRAAVHVDTSVSHSYRKVRVAGIPIRTIEGELPSPVERIARLADDRGLDVVVLADRARAEVSYGLTRFSRLFTVTASEGSIAEYGSRRYLQRVKRADENSRAMIIPGAECIPYYRWRGSPFTGLRLSHLYEHMVLAGLDTERMIDDIPDTAGGYGYRFSWTVLLNLPFLGLIAWGAWLWCRKPKSRRQRIIAGLLIALPALILIDSAPFLPHKISAYDLPTMNPADTLAEYARHHGALAFWAHPSAHPGSLPHRLRQSSGIDIEVEPYRDVLHRTRCYTGFAMFNAGIQAGKAGQEWDEALGQYCEGERPRPVWVISECDFDAHSPPEALSHAVTVLWARERSKKAVLDALQRGRCYATLGDISRDLSVEGYELTDGSDKAISGETLRTSAAAAELRVRLAATAPEKLAAQIERKRSPVLQVIVDGVGQDIGLRRVGDGATFEAVVAVPIPRGGKMSYVRALVCDNGQPVLALNPIFVLRGNGPQTSGE